MDTGSELYARFQEGDESAFAELIRIYRVGLICFIDQMVCDPDLAENLAEDVFVHLAVKKPKDSQKSSFKTWIYTIARNQTVSYLRFHARRKTVSFDDQDEPEDPDANLETAFLKSERDRRIHRALQTIRPIYREVLWLMYFEDKSCPEIASILKKSPHNVETIASRARAALRNKLQKEGYPYEIV